MRHNYHERKQNRIDNAEAQAAKNVTKSDQLSARSVQMTQCLPMGQPILVGHHSERGHRRLLDRSWRVMGQAVAADKKADYYNSKADSIKSNTAIASDNPDALPLLKEKLAKKMQEHELLKAALKAMRKKDPDIYLKLPGATPEKWAAHLKEGIASYELPYLNKDIKRLKDRITEQEAIEAIQHEEQQVKDCTMIINPHAGRVQLVFPDKPAEEIRKMLRGYAFNFSYQEVAWQRKLNNGGIWAAREFLKRYAAMP